MKLIKNELTSKERLKLYSQGKEVDRIPVTLTASETIPLLYGIDICDYYFSADHMYNVETMLANDFDADNMGMGLGLRTLVEALGTKLQYPKNNVSSIMEPALKDYSNLDNMPLVNIEKDGRFPILIEAFSRLIDTFGDTKIISTGMAGPLTTSIGLIGTEKFLKDSIKDKANVHKLLEYSSQCIIKCAHDLNRKLGINVSLSEPMVARNILSLKQFKELEKPYLTKIVSEFKKFQSAPGIHVCGTTKDRWLDLVETGISSFSIDNCENMKELKLLFGDKIAISGNVDPVNTLRYGTFFDIEAEVKKCLLNAADNPNGFTLSPGCTVPIMTPKENIIAFMNAASIYGKHTQKGILPRGIEIVI